MRWQAPVAALALLGLGTVCYNGLRRTDQLSLPATSMRSFTALRGMQHARGMPMTTSRAKNARSVFMMASPEDAKNIYEFSGELLDGSTVDFSAYKGKILLIENVATL